MGDTHGKLLVVNLFILPGKTATGYPDTILNTLRNKTGLDASAKHERERLEISGPGGHLATCIPVAPDQKM